MFRNLITFHTVGVKRTCTGLLVAMAYAGSGTRYAASGSATQPAATQPANWIVANNKIRADLSHRWLNKTQFQTTLADAIDYMRDVTGLKFEVQWEKLKAVGITEKTAVTVNLPKSKTQDVLIAILTSAAGKPGIIGYAVERGAVVIGPTHPPAAQSK